MNISTFCINRPVATILMSVAVLLGGLFSWQLLPVAALPKAEFPTVSVSADLPGASPDIMATSVATPLIKQFSTIAGVDTISSSSSLGTTNITIQFVLSRPIDAAAADVQAAISRVQRQLPQNMTQPPSYRKVNPADAPVMLLAIKSDLISMTDLDNIAENIISPTLSTVDGVAQVQIFGPQQYAVHRDGPRCPGCQRHNRGPVAGSHFFGQQYQSPGHADWWPTTTHPDRQHPVGQCGRVCQSGHCHPQWQRSAPEGCVACH